MPPTNVCPQCKAAVPACNTEDIWTLWLRLSKSRVSNLWEKSITVSWLSQTCYAHSVLFLPLQSSLTSFWCFMKGLCNLSSSFPSWYHTVWYYCSHAFHSFLVNTQVRTITCTAVPRVWHFSAFYWSSTATWSYKQLCQFSEVHT